MIKKYKGYDLTTPYGCITFVKEVFAKDLAEEFSYEEFYGVIRTLRRANIKLATALETVLTVGRFTESGTFMLPATRDCLAEFKSVARLLKKRRPLYMVEYGNYYEVEMVDGEEVYHYFMTTTYYKLTHNDISIKEKVEKI